MPCSASASHFLYVGESVNQGRIGIKVGSSRNLNGRRILSTRSEFRSSLVISIKSKGSIIIVYGLGSFANGP